MDTRNEAFADTRFKEQGGQNMKLDFILSVALSSALLQTKQARERQDYRLHAEAVHKKQLEAYKRRN